MAERNTPSFHPGMALFPMSGVLRGFPSAEYHLYTSTKTLVRPCSSKKLLIHGLETCTVPSVCRLLTSSSWMDTSKTVGKLFALPMPRQRSPLLLPLSPEIEYPPDKIEPHKKISFGAGDTKPCAHKHNHKSHHTYKYIEAAQAGSINGEWTKDAR